MKYRRKQTLVLLIVLVAPVVGLMAAPPGVGKLKPHPDVTKPDRLQFERGLGIPLMRELTDQLEFRHEGGGTTVRFVLTSHLRG